MERKNQAVKLTSQGEKAIRTEHPWIFESSINKISDTAQAGDRAVIFDHKKNQFLGLGLIDPFSPIRIKMLVFKKSAKFNEQWLNAKIQLAFEKRKTLLETDTNSFRLIYGENDGLPGLICDVYDQVAVIKLYSHIWIPYLSWIVNSILDESPLQKNIIKKPIETVVLRLSRSLQKNKRELHGLKEGQVIHGVLDEETIVFREHGLNFSANVIHGHKTGYFLDHRENRRKVGAFAKNKKVLDVFSYAGGFSVHALVGGAKTVTSLDISKPALKLAKFNATLNGDYNNHITIAGDAFAEMRKLQHENEKFDLIIVDPPSFAKRSSEIDSAIISYRRLTRLAIQLADKSAVLVLASCSSRITKDVFTETVLDVFESQRRHYTVLDITAHDSDHPVTFPEGSYLKTMYIRLE